MGEWSSRVTPSRPWRTDRCVESGSWWTKGPLDVLLRVRVSRIGFLTLEDEVEAPDYFGVGGGPSEGTGDS